MQGRVGANCALSARADVGLGMIPAWYSCAVAVVVVVVRWEMGGGCAVVPWLRERMS